MFGEHPVPHSVATQLLLTLDRFSRHLCSPLYRCLLCPVGEGFEGTRAQPPHGVCHRLLWSHCYHRKREKTTSTPHSETHPVMYPCPVAYRYFPLPSGASDFVHPLGDCGPDVCGPTNGRCGCLVCDITTPSHGCGHSNSTHSAQILYHRLRPLTMHFNRFIECTISTIGTLSCVSYPR